MVSFTEERLNQIFKAMKTRKIAVIGDLMVDKYIWGDVLRISPEAPVPVVEVTDESERLGGAANVGLNLVGLGGKSVLIGVCGDDSQAAQMKDIVTRNGMDAGGIVTDKTRRTTVKTRVIAQQQHVVRIDQEHRHHISKAVEKQILDYLTLHIDEIDGIILEDYNKGVLTLGLIKDVISLANQHRKLITVDPKKNHFFDYQNVTLFKPNLKETSEGLNRKLHTDEEVIEAGTELLKKLNAEYVLITRSEKGMSLFKKDGSHHHVPTQALHVADVSGAGDTVIATLTLALAAGASIEEASALANLAGGFVVGEVGILPAKPEQVLEFWRKVK
ncbi:MAG: D-glycero-beta-D-manno-heptose-7-phosphate kinase [Bacteroidetes bacterium]|nr:D-glycero-beta-D-manno-heptose-7-phosphate kinase [Bacteroidota bacterium]